jgi:hypothetical protein
VNKNSQSIEESKKNGVFCFLLNVNKSAVLIEKNKTDTIREIWVENMWMYTDNGSILKDSAEQLLISFSNASRKYNDKLFLKVKNNYFGWNGVFFNSYSNLRDTIYVISTVAGTEMTTDTILVNKS